jgi:hypothetical protein
MSGVSTMTWAKCHGPGNVARRPHFQLGGTM